jgi:hypothetical protein
MLNELGLLPKTDATLSHAVLNNTFLRYLGQPQSYFQPLEQPQGFLDVFARPRTGGQLGKSHSAHGQLILTNPFFNRRDASPMRLVIFVQPRDDD